VKDENPASIMAVSSPKDKMSVFAIPMDVFII
jgi:hypothetical protein